MPSMLAAGRCWGPDSPPAPSPGDATQTKHKTNLKSHADRPWRGGWQRCLHAADVMERVCVHPEILQRALPDISCGRMSPRASLVHGARGPPACPGNVANSARGPVAEVGHLPGVVLLVHPAVPVAAQERLAGLARLLREPVCPSPGPCGPKKDSSRRQWTSQLRLPPKGSQAGPVAGPRTQRWCPSSSG